MASRVGDRWRGRVYLKSGGERTKTFPTKREAIAWEVAERGQCATSTATLAQFIGSSSPTVLGGLSPSTHGTYRSHLAHRIIPELGHVRIDRLTTGRVQEAVVAWSSSGVSASVVNGSLNCLARFLHHGVHTGEIRHAVTDNVQRIRAGIEHRAPTLTLVELAALVEAATDRREEYGRYVQVAAYAGTRAGETMALQAQDVDLDMGVIRVRRTISAGKPKAPKSWKPRSVPILEPVRPLLEELVGGAAPTRPLLPGPKGGRIHHANAMHRLDWPRLVERLGFPGFRFHDLRATAIVLWIRAGVPLVTVKEMAGHASLSTTDRYARMARDDISSAGSQIDSYIARTREGEAAT